MRKSDVRHKQWEIADSLFSYLETGKLLNGKVNEIIKACDIHADGYSVAKFLERAQSMARSPFVIQRTLNHKIPYSGLSYRIALKTR